jgi:uncharacterized membrane protein
MRPTLLLAALLLVPLAATVADAQAPGGNGNFTRGAFGPRPDPVFQATLVVHIVAGVMWAGAVLFLFAVLGPAIRGAADRPTAEFLRGIAARSRIGLYMPLASIVSVGTGVWMYAQRSFILLNVNTPTSALFNAGVACGLIAFAHGAWFQNRLLRRVRAIDAGLGGEPPTEAHVQELGRIAAGIHKHNLVSAALLVITVVGMGARGM